VITPLGGKQRLPPVVWLLLSEAGGDLARSDVEFDREFYFTPFGPIFSRKVKSFFKMAPVVGQRSANVVRDFAGSQGYVDVCLRRFGLNCVDSDIRVAFFGVRHNGLLVVVVFNTAFVHKCLNLCE